MSVFFERIALSQDAQNTLLCIGLDPDPAKFPRPIRRCSQPIFEFNKAIIDATSDLVCCYKPQIAHYSALGAESALQQTIDYIHDRKLPVLLDAKRGDVGNTAEKYAIELFERYQADAITINPYLGADAMAPYLEYQDKGIFILCRTSNPGGADLQNLVLKNGKHLYEHVAQEAARVWNRNGNVGLVVGATQPSELARIRQLVGSMTLLIPGVGAQGGDIASSVAAGQGGGMLVSSSRAILYASSEADFAGRARAAAIITRDKINSFRPAA
ncbi:MAG: orotidine-5'-phosphate decarboxylase [Pseudomonadales bacterium]